MKKWTWQWLAVVGFMVIWIQVNVTFWQVYHMVNPYDTFEDVYFDREWDALHERNTGDLKRFIWDS